jgi:hypothetical protein
MGKQKALGKYRRKRIATAAVLRWRQLDLPRPTHEDDTTEKQLEKSNKEAT